jgi:CRISPR-associated endonuclease/helicase Cas3
MFCAVLNQDEWMRGTRFWAKTTPEGEPGISVRDHCLNAGCVAETLLAAMPKRVLALLPAGTVMLAALHDVGKITLGFQVKCPRWLQGDGLPKFSSGEAALSVSDHALVSQVFLQKLLGPATTHLWAVAVGSHHGRPKGRNARLNSPEAVTEWAEENRLHLMEELRAVFGPLPTTPPDLHLAPYHSDLWLLAGLISVADWIGSNEAWFSPEQGLPPDTARKQARDALWQIGWPGGRLRLTQFSDAFATASNMVFHGRCVFGDDVSSVTYDPRLGIFAERSAQPTPEWNDNDEFDN